MQVEAEIYKATKVSLLAVVASHALLMAFALKLKMGAALRQKEAAAGGGAGGWVDACTWLRGLPGTRAAQRAPCMWVDGREHAGVGVRVAGLLQRQSVVRG
jgi:hypothetical protein